MIEQIALGPKWSQFSVDDWFERCQSFNGERPSYKFLPDEEMLPLIDELYRLLPLPGYPTHPPTVVVLAPGNGIAEHVHSEYVLVYYIATGKDTGRLMVNGEPVEVKANHAVILPPHTPHSVEKNRGNSLRISLALRWQTEGESK